MHYQLSTSLRADIQTRLAGFEPQAAADKTLTRAGVALVVSSPADGGAAGISLTLRTARLKRHSGQFALPGGRCDAGETPVEAALRETHEEIGILLGEDAVLGVLDDMVTRTGFAMTPVVVWAGQVAEFRPDPVEVDTLYQIPLTELAECEHPSTVADRASGEPVMSIVLPSVGYRMFAPTAAVIYQFREVCLFGRHTRVAHMGQPEFTAR